MKNNQNKGSLYAILSGLCYGLVGYFGVSIMDANLSLCTMLFWRFLISSILVGIVLICMRKSITEKPVEILKALFCGAAFYTGTSIIYFISSNYIGTGLAMVIFFTYPAIIMLFNWFFYKKRIPKTYYIALALITVGMILLIDLSTLTYDIMGIGAGILSAFFYAGYILLSKRADVSPLVSTLMVSLGCMLSCFILAQLDHSFIIPATLLRPGDYEGQAYTVWVNIFGMAIICTTIPMLLLLESLKNISEEKASILSVLEPVFVVFFGILLLHETVNIVQIFGVITILSGALITLLSKKN